MKKKNLISNDRTANGYLNVLKSRRPGAATPQQALVATSAQIKNDTAQPGTNWFSSDPNYRGSAAGAGFGATLRNVITKSLSLSGSQDLGGGHPDFPEAAILREYMASEVMTTLSMVRVVTSVAAFTGCDAQWTTPERYFISPFSLMGIAELGRNINGENFTPTTINFDATATLQGWPGTTTGTSVLYNVPVSGIAVFIIARPYDITKGQSTFTINYNGIPRLFNINANNLARVVIPVVGQAFIATIAHSQGLSGANGVLTDVLNLSASSNEFTAYMNVDPNYTATSPKYDGSIANSSMLISGSNVSLQIQAIVPTAQLSSVLDELLVAKYGSRLAEGLLIGYSASGLGGNVNPATMQVASVIGSGGMKYTS